MAWGYSDISEFMNQFDRKILNEQANMAAPLIRGDQKGYVKVKDRKGQVGVVQIKSGGFASTGVIADGAPYNVGGATTFYRGTYGPVIFTSRPLFPIGQLRIAEGGDGIDLLKEGTESAAADCWRILERAVLNAQLASPAVATLAAATSFLVSDPSGFRPGDSFDVYTDLDVYKESPRVVNITIPSSGNSTITLESATGFAWATNYKLFLHGQTPSSQMASLAGVNDSTSGLYTGLTASTFPPGENNSTVLSWGNDDGGQLVDRIARRSGMRPDGWIASSRGRRLMYNAQNSQTRFSTGTVDVYGNMLTFDGLPIYISENQSDTTIDLCSSDKMELHRFYDFGADGDGDSHTGMSGKAGLQLSQDNYNYIWPLSGAFNLRVTQRNAFARFSALAS